MNIKKVAILVVILLFSANIYCQKNTFYASAQPVDLGYGIRYDRKIDNFGVYASMSKGKYKIPEEFYIEKHIKLSLGGIAYSKYDCTFLSYGFNYNIYGDYFLSDNTSRMTTYPVSIELGAGVLFPRMSMAVRLDMLKWESSIDLGIRF